MRGLARPEGLSLTPPRPGSMLVCGGALGNRRNPLWIQMSPFHPHGHIETDGGIVKLNGMVGKAALSLEITAAVLLESAAAYALDLASAPYPDAYREATLARHFLDIVAEIKSFAGEDRILYQFRPKHAFNRHFRFDCDNPKTRTDSGIVETPGARDRDAPARWPQHAVQGSHQSGLAGARWAYDSGDTPGFECQRQFVQDFAPAPVHRQTVHGDGGTLCGGLCASRRDQIRGPLRGANKALQMVHRGRLAVAVLLSWVKQAADQR
jgi:hypothetical protein